MPILSKPWLLSILVNLVTVYTCKPWLPNQTRETEKPKQNNSRDSPETVM